MNSAFSESDWIENFHIVALTLWRLQTIGHLFGAAVCTIVKDVCSAIVKLMLPCYIKGEYVDKVIHVHGFHFKNVLGQRMGPTSLLWLPMTFLLTTTTVQTIILF